MPLVVSLERHAPPMARACVYRYEVSPVMTMRHVHVYADLLSKILVADPKQRATIEDIMLDEWFQVSVPQ